MAKDKIVYDSEVVMKPLDLDNLITLIGMNKLDAELEHDRRMSKYKITITEIGAK